MKDYEKILSKLVHDANLATIGRRNNDAVDLCIAFYLKAADKNYLTSLNIDQEINSFLDDWAENNPHVDSYHLSNIMNDLICDTDRIKPYLKSWYNTDDMLNYLTRPKEEYGLV